MFKVGDKVRIKDQQHPHCGYYGVVTYIDGDVLTIGCVTLVTAFQSQVEAA